MKSMIAYYKKKLSRFEEIIDEAIESIKEIKVTTKTEETRISFWDNNHPRQEEYQKLYDDLVPDEGEANTVNGELIRTASRLYWDYCNNGNGNAFETEEVPCGNCNGDCTIDGCPYCEDGDDNCETCGGDDRVDCEYCGGSGVEDGDTKMNKYFDIMLDYLIKHIGEKAQWLRNFILQTSPHYTFNQAEMNIYDNVMIEVLDYIKTHENVERG